MEAVMQATKTRYLFATGCFKRAGCELSHADRSARERILSALKLIGHVVPKDLPKEARSPFKTIRYVIHAQSNSPTLKFDIENLDDVVSQICDKDIEQIHNSILAIAQSIDEYRQPEESTTLTTYAQPG